MSFEKTLPHTLKSEGGYVDDPLDSGGETFRGISRKANPNWLGWKLIDAAKAKGIKTAAAIDALFKNDPDMEKLVADLYKANYYDPFRA